MSIRDDAQNILSQMGVGYSNKTWDRLEELLMQYQSEQLEELRLALEFFDAVQNTKSEDRVAVGNDHWDWLISAVRKMVGNNENK